MSPVRLPSAIPNAGCKYDACVVCRIYGCCDRTEVMPNPSPSMDKPHLECPDFPEHHSSFSPPSFRIRMNATVLPRDAGRQAPRVRRPRAARACDLCRAKKNKCDELSPCSYCRARDLPCVYQGQQPMAGRITTDYVKQLEDQVKRLDAELRQRSVATPTITPVETMQVDTVAQLPRVNESSPAQSMNSQHARESDVSGINRHTRDVEFYGSSSSVALLSHVQNSERGQQEAEDDGQLVSTLHNPAFRTNSTGGGGQGFGPEALHDHSHYYPQFRIFLESFFSSIHYVHPILDRVEFFQRCDGLWSKVAGTKDTNPVSSFMALYYSVLSLGAIVGPRSEEAIDGLSNLQWSRRFFDTSRTLCNQLGLATDLEMVQCYFIMVRTSTHYRTEQWNNCPFRPKSARTN